MTDALEVRIVELRKCRAPDAVSTEDPLLRWQGFLQYANRKEVSDMLARKDPGLDQAVRKLREISQDEKERIRAFEREKDLLWDAMNRYNREQQAKRIEAKALEKGMAEGRAKGEAEGKAKGEAEGKAETERRIAIHLLKKGISVEEVAEALERQVSEIEDIRKESVS